MKRQTRGRGEEGPPPPRLPQDGACIIAAEAEASPALSAEEELASFSLLSLSTRGSRTWATASLAARGSSPRRGSPEVEEACAFFLFGKEVEGMRLTTATAGRRRHASLSLSSFPRHFFTFFSLESSFTDRSRTSCTSLRNSGLTDASRKAAPGAGSEAAAAWRRAAAAAIDVAGAASAAAAAGGAASAALAAGGAVALIDFNSGHVMRALERARKYSAQANAALFPEKQNKK